ncbi:MAG: DUF3299 domain-containing protein [Bryobacter sp.]|nr:DUF3299 domain-containing protein [Bryobacter sp.]
MMPAIQSNFTPERPKAWLRQLQFITAILVAFGLCACGPTYKTVEVSDAAQPPEDPPKALVQPTEAMPLRPPEDSLPGYRKLDWRTLRGLNVTTGRATPEVTALSGANVRIRGYMVPFVDEDESVSEFLLVPVAGMCIHTPPPPMNQIIMVESAGGASRVEWDKELEVYGQLSIAESDSPYGKTGYKILAIRARAQ